MTDKPFPNSYWVIPGTFLAGAYPTHYLYDLKMQSQLAAFLEAGINTFFDLTRTGELPPYLSALQQEASRYGISVDYQQVHFQDKGLPSHEEMVALLDAVDSALHAGRKVYLHCWGGIGRTGVAVGCWLVRHGLTGEQALIRLNELYRTSEQSRIYPQAPETPAQVRFILEWSEHALA